MLTIKDSQFEAYRNKAIDEFIVKLKLNLDKENIDYESDEQLRILVNDSLGANIEAEIFVYEYVKLALANKQMRENPKPDWLRNILYVKLNSDVKIESIKRYLLSQ